MGRCLTHHWHGGLREIAIGFYGVGAQYDRYAHRMQAFSRMEDGLSYTRKQYGATVRVTLGWLLMRPTCTVEAVREAFDFGSAYQSPLNINLLHHSLPYFTEGPDRVLAFRSEDRSRLVDVVEEWIRLKELHPQMIENSVIGLRSIPDWLLRRSAMRVPCDGYRTIWIGADGTVALCQAGFELGNLHERRLRDLLFTRAHGMAARDAFALSCPNCHCNFDRRTRLHGPSRRAYASAEWCG